jgi:hypothetical protein
VDRRDGLPIRSKASPLGAQHRSTFVIIHVAPGAGADPLTTALLACCGPGHRKLASRATGFEFFCGGGEVVDGAVEIAIEIRGQTLSRHQGDAGVDALTGKLEADGGSFEEVFDFGE